MNCNNSMQGYIPEIVNNFRKHHTFICPCKKEELHLCTYTIFIRWFYNRLSRKPSTCIKKITHLHHCMTGSADRWTVCGIVPVSSSAALSSVDTSSQVV